mmetsp:Transcript_90675/g.270625  ORF Transcript_90675/g.270625 Transcript_90675/m.270625 type:complete len:267 (-) Transcript_90675:15-815(-)
MDVVAHARAVRRVVVVPKDAERLPATHGHLLHKGHQVVGEGARALAYPPRGVRPNWVEVPQDGHPHVLVCLCGVHHDLLDHVLGPAVGVRAPQRLLLVKGLLAGPVDGCRRGKHNGGALVLDHGVEDVEGPPYVVLVVPEGLGDGLPDGLEPSKVDDAVKLLRGKELVDGFCVAHVHPEQRHILAGDLFQSVHDLRAGIHQVVHDGHVEAVLNELDHRVRADVTCAAGAAYVRRHGLSSERWGEIRGPLQTSNSLQGRGALGTKMA